MIVEINKDFFDINYDSFLTKDYVSSELEQNPFGKFLVLIENETIIGYIYYSDIYERVEINQFEINLIHRNCGKGQKLLQSFIKKVDKDITLEVKEDNYAAIHIYSKNGFVKTAIRKGYYNGIDGILMERKNEQAL